MIDFENTTGKKLDIAFLEKIAQDLTSQDVELILVSDEEIRKLNKRYRGIDKATDVLSFPLEKSPNALLGSIVISVDHIEKAAKTLGHSEQEELALLFIHGLLHLLGYDHEVDSGQMRQKEAELIRKYALPKSLIVRSEG